MAWQNRAKIYAGKTEKRNFGLRFSTSLSKIACCSRNSRSVWQNFRQKHPKEKFFFCIWDFFTSPKVGAHPLKFSFFWPRKKYFLGGWYNSASQWPSWLPGHIRKHAPTCNRRVLAQKTFVILRKRWPSIMIASSGAGQLVRVRADGLGLGGRGGG